MLIGGNKYGLHAVAILVILGDLTEVLLRTNYIKDFLIDIVINYRTHY